MSFSPHRRSELWSESGRNTQDSHWSFAKPSLKLTFSSMPGTQKWVVKVSSDALKVRLPGSAASSPSQGHGRSCQPQKAIRAALPLSRLLSMGGIPKMEPQGGTGAEGQILLQLSIKLTFWGGVCGRDSESTTPSKAACKLLCAPVFFWGRVRRIPQISQGVRDRKRGRTNKPGRNSSGHDGHLWSSAVVDMSLRKPWAGPPSRHRPERQVDLLFLPQCTGRETEGTWLS